MKPEDILEQCLKEIAAGRKTPAECAALFPNVPDLEAQLRAATTLRQLEVLTPRPEASQRIEARTLKGIFDLRQKLRAQKPMAARRRISTLRWAMPLALVTTLLFGMVGTVAASSDSVPGNPLYPVKRASETVQVILTPASKQAALHITLAQHRLDEITILSQAETVDLNLLTDLTNETETALNLMENTPAEEQSEVLSAIILLTERQQAILTAVKVSAPPQAQAGLDRAIEASSHNQEVAQGHLEQGTSPNGGPGASATAKSHPTQIPPGQQKKTDTPPESTDAEGHGPDSPNCKANNPNSSNDCTPTPSLTVTPVSNSALLCETQNGQATKNPKCKKTSTPCPVDKPGRSKCK